MSDQSTGPRQIAAATDLSAGGDAAVRRALHLAAQHRATLTVVHVVPAGLDPDLVEVADQALRRSIPNRSTVAVTPVIATGSVAAEITRTARRRQADLIVIGAHGQHRLKDLFIGSTSESVADLSHLPVLLVKNHHITRYQTVLTAVDDSTRSLQIGQAALALAPEAHHLIAHAVSVTGENLLRLSGADEHAIDQLREVQLTQARPAIEHLARALPAHRPPEVLIEPGRAEQVIPDLADRHHVDLVVVGTQQISGIRHALLGSIARHTIRHAPGDILIAHTP